MGLDLFEAIKVLCFVIKLKDFHIKFQLVVMTRNKIFQMWSRVDSVGWDNV